jgi:uncharacterized protein (TIGR03118 family)
LQKNVPKPQKENVVKPYRLRKKLLVPAFAVLALCLASQNLPAQPDTFKETDLVSDIPGRAAVTDPSLVNPWGISSSATSPFWVSDNGTGLSTLYNTAGAKQGLTVTIPPPAGSTDTSAPTGTVFNAATTSFGGARFIFATEGGTIDAWSSGTTAVAKVDNSGSGAEYKGLAIGNNGSGNYLYATNFTTGNIDVFDSNFAATSLTGSFTDPTMAAGYRPFNVQNLGGQLYVTYALRDPITGDDVGGPGHGFVDVFDLNGNLVRRLASMGPLDSPWGLALAPSGFGPFAGDLLVGNFGDGMINVFDPLTGMFIDSLRDPSGNPIVVEGLWGLIDGNGGSGGAANSVYFAAGIAGDGSVEDHGLFGRLSSVPDTGMTLLMVAGALIGLIGLQRYWPKPFAIRI